MAISLVEIGRLFRKIIGVGRIEEMENSPPEIGQLFCKTDSHGIVWTLDSISEFSETVHGRLTRLDDPTTSITVSINVLSDPRRFRKTVVER